LVKRGIRLNLKLGMGKPQLEHDCAREELAAVLRATVGVQGTYVGARGSPNATAP
jgi:hypothetical protein